MSQKRLIHIFTLGFALFAMFFGAGNLLLPPFIGLQVSDSWFWTTLGFMITAIIIPFLGIISVVVSGENFTDLGRRINKNVGILLGVVIMIGIGPLIAIPRTAATTYEVGLLPLFPQMNSIAASIAFFVVVVFLSISSSKVVDLIGNYLTPVLIIILFSLITIGVLNPEKEWFEDRFGRADAFILGFEEGYQTLDVLASVIFAGIIITAARVKGYTSVIEKKKVVIRAGLLAAICLLFIYGGLVYLGASSLHEWTSETKRAPLLLHISNVHLGGIGSLAMAICIALACLTTAIALTSAVGSFFSELFKNKIGYKTVVIICSILSCALSITGVDSIIEYAYPFLAFVYPIVITLVLYIVIFNRLIKEKSPYVGAIIGTTLISLVGLLDGFNLHIPVLERIVQSIPLAAYDLAWIIPSIVGFLLGIVYAKITKEEIESTSLETI